MTYQQPEIMPSELSPRGAMARLFAATALLFCSMAIVSPSADALVRDQFGLGNEATSHFFLVHSLPQLLLLGVLVGVFSDRIGRRLPIAILCGAGTGITTMLHPVMHSFESLLMVRLLDGILGVAAIGMLMTRAVELVPTEKRARAMGMYLASIPTGYLVGSILVAVAGTANLALPFLIAGSAMVAGSLVLAVDLFRPEPMTTRQPGIGAVLRAVRGARRLWYPMFFGFVDKFTFAALAMLTALALSDRYQLSAIVWGGSALGLFWIGYLVTSMPAGAICRSWGPWRTVAFGSCLYGIVLCLLLVFESPIAFLALLVAAGALVALQSVPCILLVGETAGREGRATAMAAFNTAGSFGMVLGFVWSGIASAHWGYLAAFIGAGVLEIFSSIIAYAASRGNPPASVVYTKPHATPCTPSAAAGK